MTDKALTLVPEAEALAPPLPNCGALKLADALSIQMTNATGYIVSELDQLIEQIEAIKTKVIDDSSLVREAIDGHFRLASEALAFRAKVSQRLGELIGGPGGAPP
jgi:hypothetical protein